MMSLISATNLAKEFGPDEIFGGVSVEIPHGARIALVGPNGAGKTTLLRILIGLDLSSDGTVSRSRGLRIGFLPQRPELLGEHTLWAELMTAFTDLRAQEAELTRLENDLADPDKHEAAIAVYGELQEKFELAGGYTYEQRTRTVLHGLGFAPEDYNRPLSQLSGGQKTRALLGRLLLEAPDLLALDEPTNHLDIEAIEWLEGFLNEFEGAVLVVSHDRYFMDAVAKTIWELDFGTLELYRGNYSHYVQQREERHERLLKEYETQQEFIAKEEEYIRRNLAGQNTKQAQGRRTRLERYKRDKLILRPRTRQNMNLRINTTGRSGDKVLETKKLTVGYPGSPLFSPPDLVLMRTEVAALIGPNGAGKSTFVKTIIGDLAPVAGEVKIGAAVKIGYFAQAHELLNEKNSILDEIQTVKAMGLTEARSYLGQFLFQGDDVFRPIYTLSGGERGRVALAKLALAGANFLLLDEPTNHLDIDSQEILQNVLADFNGTILLVSHDRYLIDALATQIWSVSPGRMDVFKGTYREFVDARRNGVETNASGTKSAAPPTNGQAKAAEKKHGLNPYQLQKRIAELEALIPQLEQRLAEIIAEMGTASASADGKRVRSLGEAYTQTEAELHATMTEWERLIE
ncbi:MAG TPA: ABC-F family ATP-binding cassette domain-containing protein [Phototrophicaceae bacterium]|nr:ABC-F family ATP-binding cassette domain-containing protein [Phototrophicaceae bacterium]